MIDDIILNKKESIERCILQIKNYYSMPTNLPFEEDSFKQDAIALNLQRAVEMCIDLANHIVRIKKLGIPKESRDCFSLFAANGIISKQESARLVGMVGFRNVLVHEYQEMDISIMKDVIENHLNDMVNFTVIILDLK